MLDTIFTSLPELSLIRTVIRMFAALIAGGFISLSYIHSDKRQKYSSNFAMTVIILPAIVSVVITLIGSDLAKAISLGGVFALVRFRSVPGDSRDIAYVFFAIVVGLAIGMDCYAIAFALTAVVALAFTLLQKMNYAKNKNASEILKITVPPDKPDITNVSSVPSFFSMLIKLLVATSVGPLGPYCCTISYPTGFFI